MSTITKDLGPVSAYAYAVTQGYTGTEEEFAELMADYADVGQTAVEAAQTATTKASEASASAGTASTAATTATTKASEATTAAGTASTAASTATTKASEANTSAGTAAQNATTAVTKASEAATSATAAASSATAAEAAQTAAETAETNAEAEADRAEAYADRLINVYPTDTASGSIASFPDGAGGVEVKTATVQIVPKQSGSGDPSPSNVRPISGWNAVEVTQTGKNLLNNKTRQDASSRLWLGTDESTPYYILLKAGTYTLSASLAKSARFIAKGSNDSSNINVGSASNAPYGTFAIVTDDLYSIWLYASDGITSEDVNYFQLEPGSTATPYAPYQSTTHTLPLPSTVYGGQAVYEGGGMWTVTSNMAYDQMTYAYLSGLSSSHIGYMANVSQVGGGAIWVHNWHYQDYPARVSGGIEAVCNAFRVSMHDSDIISSQYRTYFAAGSMTSVAEFLAAVQALEANGDGLWIAHELMNPQTYTVTTEQLLTSLKGQNNIFADSGDTSVTYRADIQLYIDKLTGSTEDDMTADSNIPNNTYFLVGNTLYKSTAAIEQGATIAPGTNCTKTDLAAALNALQ